MTLSEQDLTPAQRLSPEEKIIESAMKEAERQGTMLALAIHVQVWTNAERGKRLSKLEPEK